jgi:hypothetical protein
MPCPLSGSRHAFGVPVGGRIAATDVAMATQPISAHVMACQALIASRAQLEPLTSILAAGLAVRFGCHSRTSLAPLIVWRPCRYRLKGAATGLSLPCARVDGLEPVLGRPRKRAARHLSGSNRAARCPPQAPAAHQPPNSRGVRQGLTGKMGLSRCALTRYWRAGPKKMVCLHLR